MSKGIPSKKAFDAAVAIASTRGQITFLQDWPGSFCDFLVMTPYGILAVSVKRTRRIRAEVAEIAMDFNETLNMIRAADHCPGIYCEFWLWSPYGTMRFFEVEGFRLTELGLTGLPLVPLVTGKFSGQPGNSTETPATLPGIVQAGQTDSPEKGPGTTTGRKNPAAISLVPAPAQPAPPEPHYIQYLRHRNAEIQRKNEEAAVTGGKPVAGPTPVLPGPGEEGSPAENSPPGRA
ncbi:MAG: hypothetical protein M0Q92_07615 [Methanoregula sp.]|jgi:hypothetical protein|nr:hypothetical protein [Methanoregula sp.]